MDVQRWLKKGWLHKHKNLSLTLDLHLKAGVGSEQCNCNPSTDKSGRILVVWRSITLAKQWSTKVSHGAHQKRKDDVNLEKQSSSKVSHRSHQKKEDDINFRPPQEHECTYICTDTIIKMEKDSFSLFHYSSSCPALLALPAAGCLCPCSILDSVCSFPAGLCGNVSPSPCPSLPHLSHFLTVYLLSISVLAFIFQTSFSLF